MALTWRDVAAPDFSSAQNGFRQAFSMLDSALGNARGTLTQVDAKISDRVNNEFQLALLQQNDPVAMEAALAADPTLGFDTRRLSAQSISAAGNRVGALLNQANSKLALEEGQFDFGEKKDKVARMEAAAPLLKQATTLFGNGKEAEGLALLAQANVRPDEYLDWANKGFGLSKGKVDLDGSRQDQTLALGRYGMEKTRFGWEGEDRQFAADAASLAQQVLSESDGAESALYALERYSGKFNPRAIAMAREMITGQVGNLYQPGGASAAIAGAAGGGSSGGGMANFDAILQIEGGTDAKGNFRTSPAGAIGPAQVMPGTAPEAARLAGLKWDPVKYRTDAAYNKAIGNAYYNEQLRVFNGDTVKAAAAYNAGAGSAKKGTGVRGAMARAAKAGRPNDWAEFLPAETKNYVKKFRALTQGSVNSATAKVSAVVANSDEDNATGAAKYLESANNKATAAQAANALRQDPAFAKVPANFLTTKIKEIRDMSAVRNGSKVTYKLNYAQAADILSQNLNQSNQGWFRRGLEEVFTLGGASPNLGGGLRFDDKGIAAAVDAAKTGATLDSAVSQQNRAASVGAIAASEANLSALGSRVQQLRRAVAGGRTGLATELRRAEAEYAAASISHAAIQDRTLLDVEPARDLKPRPTTTNGRDVIRRPPGTKAYTLF